MNVSVNDTSGDEGIAAVRLNRVTRLTVVDDTGRAYEKFGVALRFAIQDDGKTLKVFVTERSPEEQVAAGWGQFFKMTDPYRPEAS